MELPNISTEQNNIIQKLQNNNVIVDSVAGSGKTTCNLHIAKYFSDMKILLLTYNSKLKIETREKVKYLKINNLEVHSYHSFCVKYYDKQSFNDTIINKILKTKKKPLKQFKFDLIVPDEAQDITSLYYELICKIYKDNNNPNTKICIFGDKNQSIFDFNKADQRFIEYADNLFKFNSYNWVKCNLSISFRITYEMSLFINKCLLKEDRIISNKITNNKPRYIICDCFGNRYNTFSRTFEEVKYYFNLGYKPDDIFILAPSIKSYKSPIRELENKIKREMTNVMVYVPINDEEKLDDELLEGKLIFSTFHQTKGLERKVVIIFNFDNSYFEFYKKDANRFICSNEIYVATTRGLEYLTLFHHHDKEYLDFIDKNMIHEYCYVEYEKIKNKKLEKPPIDISTSITDIIKYLPQNIIDECYDQLDIVNNDKYTISKINISSKISNDETTESVNEITGIAIPSMFELKLKNRMSIFEKLIDVNFEGCNKHINKKYDIYDIDISNLNIEELLYISNCWNTYKNGYLFKIYQITNYDWIGNKKMDECINRLLNLNISKNSIFEFKLETKNQIETLNRELIGFIDCVDQENNIIYEFKCVQKLEKEHYLQLAFYMYMYELYKIDKIGKIKRDNISSKNMEIKNLLDNKEILKKKLIHLNNIVHDKTFGYIVGDKIKYKIKYKLIDEGNIEIGEIVKIYKNGKIKVKNNDKKDNISKSDIISIIKHFDINDEICKLNDEIINIDKLIDEIKQKELNNKIKLYGEETKYILYNILTNEYVIVKCDLHKLKKIIKYLIYSRYINKNSKTDEEFIEFNKNIYKLYF